MALIERKTDGGKSVSRVLRTKYNVGVAYNSQVPTVIEEVQSSTKRIVLGCVIPRPQ